MLQHCRHCYTRCTIKFVNLIHGSLHSLLACIAVRNLFERLSLTFLERTETPPFTNHRSISIVLSINQRHSLFPFLPPLFFPFFFLSFFYFSCLFFVFLYRCSLYFLSNFYGRSTTPYHYFIPLLFTLELEYFLSSVFQRLFYLYYFLTISPYLAVFLFSPSSSLPFEFFNFLTLLLSFFSSTLLCFPILFNFDLLFLLFIFLSSVSSLPFSLPHFFL